MDSSSVGLNERLKVPARIDCEMNLYVLALKPLVEVSRFGDEAMDGLLAATDMHDRIWEALSSDGVSP